MEPKRPQTNRRFAAMGLSALGALAILLGSTGHPAALAAAALSPSLTSPAVSPLA